MSMQIFKTVTMDYFRSQVFSGNVRIYDRDSNFVEISCTDDEIIELYEKLAHGVQKIKQCRKNEAELEVQEEDD